MKEDFRKVCAVIDSAGYIHLESLFRLVWNFKRKHGLGNDHVMVEVLRSKIKLKVLSYA